MTVLTILGTRPEIIRLSRVIELLDRSVHHVLVHTGQNYDDRLSGFFFEEMGIRQPDVYLGVRGETLGEQLAEILKGAERVFLEHRPDRVLILGDTNSALSAVIARRMGIPVFHMEAGNRCYDDRVPEEINRRVVDHASSVLMPYTERSRANLLREGIDGARVFVTGNPIKQVIDSHADAIARSAVLASLSLARRKFFLVTMHRAENVDRQDRLGSLVDALSQLHAEYRLPVICSFHPRTRSKMEQFGLKSASGAISFVEPLGFFDFVRLEQEAFCILTDSGTVQEEAAIFRVPNVTIRDVTERPETIECGSNILAGAGADWIVPAVRLVTCQARHWQPPPEYLVPTVAETVSRIVCGYRVSDAAEGEWAARVRG